MEEEDIDQKIKSNKKLQAMREKLKKARKELPKTTMTEIEFILQCPEEVRTIHANKLLKEHFKNKK
jgi:hypothetical protein